MMQSAPERVVLVADDEPDIRRLVCRVLEEAGFRTVAACDGDEVLTLALAHAPAVIVMDVGMARMDGYTALTRLRAVPPTREIPVIILTGRADIRYQAISAGVGAVAHITKPFSLRRFVETVESLAGAAKA
jgi:CheY-like chemotaxis protein